MANHGIMGVGPKGFAALAVSTAFFWWLGGSFRGPEQPKFLVHPEIALEAKKYQPGIVPEYYFMRKF